MALADFSWPKIDDESDSRVIRNVKEHRCHIVAVLADDEGPGCSFSIGLYLNYGHPEVVVFGLSSEVAGAIINSVAESVEKGAVYQPRSLSSEFLEGFDVQFQGVNPAAYHDYFGYALWFYRSIGPTSFPFLQLLWPDRSGKFPTDQSTQDEFRKLQPLLGAYV